MTDLNDSYLNDFRKECVSTMLYLLTIVRDTKSIQLLQSLSIDNDRDLKEIGIIISSLWRRYGGFKRILSHSFAYRDEFEFNPNIGYFLDNIQRIMGDAVHSDLNGVQSVLNDEDIILFQADCPRNHDWGSNFQYNIRDRQFEIVDLSPSETIRM